MLKQEVIDAIKEGKFHIYPVSTIDEGIEVLTGVPAGAPGKDGKYPDWHNKPPRPRHPSRDGR